MRGGGSRRRCVRTRNISHLAQQRERIIAQFINPQRAGNKISLSRANPYTHVSRLLLISPSLFIYLFLFFAFAPSHHTSNDIYKKNNNNKMHEKNFYKLNRFYLKKIQFIYINQIYYLVIDPNQLIIFFNKKIYLFKFWQHYIACFWLLLMRMYNNNVEIILSN